VQGFYAHCGALQALEEAGLKPARVCGSSSGSIISSLYAGGLEPHTTLPELLLRLKRSDILTPWWQRPGVGVYRINTPFLAANAPAARLEDGRLPCAVSTFDLLSRRTVTHSAGDTATLIAASCAVPGIMQPVVVSGRLHVDGGVGDLLGLASCSPEERVLSIDLHTQGLMRMRSVHVALLGTRPGQGVVWAAGRWAAARLLGRGDAAAPALGDGEPVAGAAEAAVPTSRVAAPLPPILQGCARLQLRGLPFVGPRSMDRGASAMAAGREAMRAALATRSQWGGERIVSVPVPGSAPEDAQPQPAATLPAA